MPSRTGVDDTTVATRPATRPAARTATRTATRRTPPDPSERAELARRADRAPDARTARIDDTLSRITAAHAGLTLPARDATEPTTTGTSTGTAKKSAPARRPHPTVAQLLVGALAVVMFATTAFGWAAKGRLDAAVPDVAALDPDSGVIVNAAAQQGDANVLIVAGEPAGAAARSDTVTVAHVPKDGGVVAMSFPPTLEINRPPCERWDPATRAYLDETVPAQARTELISAFDVGGPRCLTRAVQQLSGLAVTGFVGMDVGSIGAIANAVGGIAVCAPRPVVDGVLGPVVPEAGRTTLDGLRATDFARAAAVPGDPPGGQVERQQLLLAAVLDQALGGPALLDVGQLTALGPALGGALVTDGVELDELTALALSLRDLDADGVTFAPVPTAGESDEEGRALLRDTDASALFAAVRADKPLPAQAQAPAAPTPDEVTVAVVNASDRAGLAAEAARTLGSLGFGVGEVGSAEQPTEQSVIRFSPDRAAAAALLAGTVPSAVSAPDPGTTGVLQLVLGRSYDGVLRPPGEPAADGAAGSAAGPDPVTCA